MAAFGTGISLSRKYLTNPKHLEFRILGDKFGHVIHLGERECSCKGTPEAGGGGSLGRIDAKMRERWARWQ
jgi:hypothetical protein